MKRLSAIATLLAIGLWINHHADAQGEGTFPFSPPEGELRLVTWNIEFLGNRNPLRTEQQLLQIAARIDTFESAVVAVQEIGFQNGQVLPRERPSLDTIVNALGWQSAMGDGQNGFIYDPAKVELLESASLDLLRFAPYSTFYSDFPNWQMDFGPRGAPFGDVSSLPELALFRAVDGRSQPFCLISTHFTFGSDNEFIRSYEGAALKRYIDERYADLSFTPTMCLVGDFNARPEAGSPHDELQANYPLNYVAKENTTITTAVGNGAELDHVYTTDEAYWTITAELAFVIRPSHYGESNVEFEATYSDHTPVFVDVLPLSFVSPIHVDGTATDAGLGTAEAPVQTVSEAITAADDGFSLTLAPGSYGETIATSKALTLTNGNPVAGSVHIGVSD